MRSSRQPPCDVCSHCRLGLGLVATGQLTHTQTEQHRDVCMMVGIQAPVWRQLPRVRWRILFRILQSKKHHLGLWYDELARKSWAERSRACDPTFEVALTFSICSACRTCRVQINDAIATVDREILSQAEAALKRH